MQIRLTTIAFTSMMALGFAGFSTAAEEQLDFAVIDINADGYITIDEVEERNAELQQRWTALDLDGDGRLSVMEYSAIEATGAGITEKAD